MWKTIIFILIGVGIAILGLVLIAIPSTGLNGEAISSGFETLKTVNVISVFNSTAALAVKIGVALSVFVAPIVVLLATIRLIAQIALR